MRNIKANTRVFTYSMLFLYLALGLLSSMPVIYPEDLMEQLSISEVHINTVIIISAAISILFFLLFCQKTLSRSYAIYKDFNHIQKSSSATVSVEFLLVIPVMLCLILTIFALAEIAHAQIVFRYAAYSAMRSGVVTNYNENKDVLRYKFELSERTKNKMKVAAAIALSTLDNLHIKDNKKLPISTSNLSDIYYKIGSKIEVDKNKPVLWISSSLIEKNILTAYNALDVTTISATRDSSAGIIPMQASIKFEYKLPLRAGSLFWFITPKDSEGYHYIKLRRTCNSETTTAYTMLSTGQRYDLPKMKISNIMDLLQFYKSLSFVPGDSRRKDIE